MITYEDIKETTAGWENNKCLSCKKDVMNSYAYKLTLIFNRGSSARFNKDGMMHKYAYFCIDCWSSIAGPEYMFTDE